MFEWIMSNWILLTAISVGLYLFVLLLEKICTGKKKEVVSEIKETGADVQV